MAITLPDFEVEVDFIDPSVHWIDGDRRYHFWLRGGKLRDDILHSNPILTSEDGHRALNIHAKKWAPLISAIMAKIKSDELVEKATVALAAKKKAAEDKRLADILAQRIAAFDRAIKTLPMNARGVLDCLTDSDKARFVVAMEVET